jgi:hypothetical protein
VSSGEADHGDRSPRASWDDLTPFPLIGHGPMEADSWTEDSADEERYQGRRRAEVRSRRWPRVAGGLVLLALIAVGAWVWWPTPPGRGSQLALTPSAAPDTDTADPGQTSAAPGARPSMSDPAPTARATAEPAFATLTVEAEAGPPLVTLIGSAHVTTYNGASGGRIVTNIGNGGSGLPGALRINDVTIPRAGRYQIAVYYTNAQSPGSHNAVVNGAGAQPIVVTFSGGRKCCGVRKISVTLAAGTYSITIANPNDTGPSIDKVVISAV